MFHEHPDTLGGFIPRDNLSRRDEASTAATGKVNAVLGLPCGDISVIGLEPEAAVKLRSEELGDFFGGLLLHILCGDTHTAAVRIAAKAQKMVDIRLGKRKSEGRLLYALRFIYQGNLLLFRGEKA